jgi:hypothetical protein
MQRMLSLTRHLGVVLRTAGTRWAASFFSRSNERFLQIRAKVSSIVNTFHKDGFKCELLNPRFIALGKNPDEARLV